jgi:hypothetical protein
LLSPEDVSACLLIKGVLAWIESDASNPSIAGASD